MLEGFDVAMHEPDAVRGVQRGGYLLDDLHGPIGIQWAAAQHMLQVLTIDQPHVHIQPAVDLPEIVDGHHVGIAQSCRGVGLPPEPLFENRVCGQLGREDLDGHYALRGGVERLPDLAHAAAAQ